MKKALCAVLCLLLLFGLAPAFADDGPPIPESVMASLPKDNMNWYDKYEAAIAEAGAEEKQVTTKACITSMSTATTWSGSSRT